jgi:hypothetical protein
LAAAGIALFGAAALAYLRLYLRRGSVFELVIRRCAVARLVVAP